MNYWKSLARDYLNKPLHQKSYMFSRYSIAEPNYRMPRKKLTIQQKKDREQRFKLGKPHENVLLTKREAQCALRFLKGFTNLDVATELSLSARTIEFYLSNLKGRLKCKTKSELIKAISQTEFAQSANHEEVG